jgi:PAS domain-containing protein
VRDILDALPEHVAVLDDRGVIVLGEPAWRALCGRERECGTDVSVGGDYCRLPPRCGQRGTDRR